MVDPSWSVFFDNFPGEAFAILVHEKGGDHLLLGLAVFIQQSANISQMNLEHPWNRSNKTQGKNWDNWCLRELANQQGPPTKFLPCSHVIPKYNAKINCRLTQLSGIYDFPIRERATDNTSKPAYY